MAQPPKFIVEPDKAGEHRWKIEAANADTTGIGATGYPTKEAVHQAIVEHIETVIGAAGVSISLGTAFEPIIEWVGYPETAPEPGPDGPYPEETTEPQEDGQDQPADT